MGNIFGICDKSYDLIVESIASFPTIEKAVIFGSRAMGNYKQGSDIDIAILGKKIDFNTTSRLHGKLNEELPIPYFIDVIDFNTINVDELKAHIINAGKVIFERTTGTFSL